MLDYLCLLPFLWVLATLLPVKDLASVSLPLAKFYILDWISGGDGYGLNELVLMIYEISWRALMIEFIAKCIYMESQLLSVCQSWWSDFK
jgi:hypothetical protein